MCFKNSFLTAVDTPENNSIIEVNSREELSTHMFFHKMATSTAAPTVATLQAGAKASLDTERQ